MIVPVSVPLTFAERTEESGVVPEEGVAVRETFNDPAAGSVTVTLHESLSIESEANLYADTVTVLEPLLVHDVEKLGKFPAEGLAPGALQS